MRAAVVYESVFGNTHAVAAAVAEGLGEACEVSLLPVTEASAETILDVDLLVVGGPTHVHGMTSARSRQAGLETAAKLDVVPDATAEGPGLRGWLDGLTPVEGGAAAAFDTRLHGAAILTGSAARGIAKRLRHRGYRLALDPESFIVPSEGAIAESELARARAWGASLAAVPAGA